MDSIRHISIRRPPIGFIVVAAAHVAFVFLLNNALGVKTFQTRNDDLITRIIDEPVEQPKVIVDPSEDFAVQPRTITVDPPDVPEIVEPVEKTDEIIAIAVPAEPEPAPSLPAKSTAEVSPSIIPVHADPRHPLTQPAYPLDAIRRGQEGIVGLQIFVLANGRIGEVRVFKSSGVPALDRAAVAEARAHWRLQPAKRGDESIDGWGNFRIAFRLANR
jgi:protein TonB